MIARAAAWATREYVLHSPLSHGKGVLLRTVASRLAPSLREVEVEVPGGVLVVRWDEVIGRRLLAGRGFERAEVAYLIARARPGATAFDVGANVGLFTVPLARVGRVVAVEPVPENADRLERAVCRNDLREVQIVRAAAGRDDGVATLSLAADGAFATTRELRKARPLGARITVPQHRLDSLWRDLGEPDVSVLKIDTEGAELDVLAGAEQLLAARAPALVVEADAPRPVREWLAARGYEERTPPGFSRGNLAFERT